MLAPATLHRSALRGLGYSKDNYQNLNLRGQILTRIQYLLENFPVSPKRIEYIGLVVGKNGELDPGGLLSSLAGKYQGRFTGEVPTYSAETLYALGSYPPTILLGPSGFPVGKLYISRYSYSLMLQLGLKFIPVTIAKHPRDQYGLDYRHRDSLCPDEEDDTSDGNMGRGVVQSRQSGGILYFHCLATEEDVRRINLLSRDYAKNLKSRDEYNLICERLINGFYGKN